MSNPYFENDPYFGTSESAQKRRRQLGLTGEPQAVHGVERVATSTLPPVPQTSDRLEEAYRLPAATPAAMGRMTYEDVVVKTMAVLGLIVLFGAVSWFGPSLLGVPEAQFPVMLVGLVGGFALGMVNAVRRNPSPGLILAYAAFEGLFLGGISSFFNEQWSGIVVQAVLATVATFAAVLMLFRSGKVRNTPKFQRVVMVALVGYVVFALVNLVLVWTGVLGGFGVYSMGPLGILISAAAVLLAAATLVIDFDGIQRGVRQGAPARYAWGAAFGLALTLVWMYLEFLRLLAILRD